MPHCDSSIPQHEQNSLSTSPLIDVPITTPTCKDHHSTNKPRMKIQMLEFTELLHRLACSRKYPEDIEAHLNTEVKSVKLSKKENYCQKAIPAYDATSCIWHNPIDRRTNE